MSDKRHTAAEGPTPAETHMFEAYDVFSRLLEYRPVEARQLAYEVHTIALRYAPQPRKKGRIHDDGSIKIGQELDA